VEADALTAMLAEDRREWSALCGALDAHPEGPLYDPESPDWTARDVYTHLAAMMEGSTLLIQECLAGKPHRRIYDGTDEDDTNARIQQRFAHMTLEDARAWAQQSFETLRATIESIPLDRWDSRIEFYARGDGSEHYRAHRNWIRG
jgi:hypothetical protein